MSEYTLFKMRGNKYCNIATPDGILLRFVNGRFFSSDKKIIKYVQSLVDSNECGIYIDPEESTVDTNDLSPDAALRRRIRAEILAEQKKAMIAPTVHPGNSVSGPQNRGAANTVSSAVAQPLQSVEDTVLEVPVMDIVSGDQTQTVGVGIANPIKVDGESGQVISPSKLNSLLSKKR